MSKRIAGGIEKDTRKRAKSLYQKPCTRSKRPAYLCVSYQLAARKTLPELFGLVPLHRRPCACVVRVLPKSGLAYRSRRYRREQSNNKKSTKQELYRHLAVEYHGDSWIGDDYLNSLWLKRQRNRGKSKGVFSVVMNSAQILWRPPHRASIPSEASPNVGSQYAHIDR